MSHESRPLELYDHVIRLLSCLLVLAAAAQLGACAPQRGAIPGPEAPGLELNATAPPAAVFADLERRLMSAPSLRIRYSVTSEGAFDAVLNGTLHLTQLPTVELEATGTFGGAPAALHLRSDAQTMEGGSAQQTFRDTTPPALRDALVLGLTRMGVLHNLARLTRGAAPDHAGGGVSEWVEVREVRHGAGATDADPTRLELSFAIFVSGTRAAEATLWLDRGTGLPLRREQVVTFPGGSMRVVEQYEFLPAPLPE